VGTRCFTGSPKTDRDGVVTETSCFDPNPAAFHIALYHWLPGRQFPFIINKRPNKKVWNVPVVGYQLEYVNVSNQRHTQDLKEAIVPLSSIAKDKYRNHRSIGTTSILGVEIKIQMAAGHTSSRDGQKAAGISNARYRYDLEIDANGKILGGEWLDDSHPDFIWAVDPSMKPNTAGDLITGANNDWDGKPFSGAWTAAAIISSRNNQPMEKVVRKLIELSTH
jgi:hypothetical protein